jgi:hypothetical protein
MKLLAVGLLTAGLQNTAAAEGAVPGGRIAGATMTGSGLVVQGIPLPQGAEPFLTANLSLENLHILAPRVGELGTGRLRAVVYNVPSAAPPDVVAAFYRRSPLIPVALALPGRVQPEQKVEWDRRARVLPFRGPPGYLAIRSEERTGPSQVTVALVEGSAPPAVVLKAVDALVSGSDDPPQPQPSSLLSPQDWASKITVEAAQLQILMEKGLPREAPGPVVDVMRSLLSQARSVDYKFYWVSRLVPAAEVLSACLQEARHGSWRLLSVEVDPSERVVALYRYRDDRGMIMICAERGPAKNTAPSNAPVAVPAPTTTQISRFEVNGQINLPSLFRPIQVRPPLLAVPDFRAPQRPTR